MDLPQRIVFYDSACGLCHASVRFIIARDPEFLFRFASLDSPLAERTLSPEERRTGQNGSVVLIENRRVLLRSDAALHILGHLSRPWRWLAALRYVPRPLRDFFYDLVARNRHRWAGKNESCPIPSPQDSERFIG